MELTLIIATGNENKVRELREILNDPELTVISMKQAGIHSDPEENGATFSENALIKARAAAEAAFANSDPAVGRMAEGTPDRAVGEQPAVILADDSGLVVDAMGGAPGILSARFLGRDTDYGYKMRYIMNELRDVEGDARSARFTCACVAVFPTDLLRPDCPAGSAAGVPGNPSLSEIVVTRSMEGQIGHEIAGANGFGYDPFFYLPEYGKTSAEITEEEKNAISHRGKAFRAMLEELRGILS